MRQPPRELSADTKRKLSEALRRRWAQRRAERKLGELDELGPCPPGERGHERPGDFYRAPIISQELRAALLAGQRGPSFGSETCFMAEGRVTILLHGTSVPTSLRRQVRWDPDR